MQILITSIINLSCGLLLSLQGVQEAKPASGSLVQYYAYLDSLDKRDLNAIARGMFYFQTHLTDRSEAEIDSACRAFIIFFDATISYHNDRIWEDLEFLKKLHDESTHSTPEMQAFLQMLDNNGLALYHFGRLYYIDQQSDYLYRRFSPHVSEGVREYLALRRDELAVGFSDSDSLRISFREVGERIIRWEHYLGRYPESAVADFAHTYYITYLSTFLTGLKNSPVFDSNWDLVPRLSSVYHDFVSRHYETLSGQLVRQFYTILEVSDFRWTPPVRDFYVTHGIRNMHVTQAPLR